MPSCEKCWGDAFRRSFGTARDQSECYHDLLKERENNPCTPKQQAGEFWDEEKQQDRRLV